MKGWLQRAHGPLMVVAGAALAVGEGVSFIALGTLSLALVANREKVRWRALVEGHAGRVIAGFGLWLCAGLLALALGGEGWQEPTELGRVGPFLAIAVVVLCGTCVERKWLRLAATAFVCSLGVACLFALAQYFLDVRPGESISRVASTIATQGRVPGHFERSVAGGFYFHRLKMAHALLVGIGGLAVRQALTELPWRRRALEVCLLCLFGVTLLLTFARTALAASLVAALVSVLIASRRARVAGAAVVLMGALALVAVPGLRAKAAGLTQHPSLASRTLIWSQGVRVIADHPFGVGLGNYSRVVSRYYDTLEPSFIIRTYPHSLVLHAWAETGPFGLAGFVAAFAALALASVLYQKRARTGPLRAVGCFGVFVVVAFWLVGFTHDVLYHNAVALVFCSTVGWLLATLDRQTEETCG